MTRVLIITEHFNIKHTYTHNDPEKITDKFYGISTIHTEKKKQIHTNAHTKSKRRQ